MDNKEIINRLNQLYHTDPTAYLRYVNNLKQAGYKVYRNDKGEHKVNGSGLCDMFGIFGDLFGRK